VRRELVRIHAFCGLIRTFADMQPRTRDIELQAEICLWCIEFDLKRLLHDGAPPPPASIPLPPAGIEHWVREQEVVGAKSLLLEVVRRAAADWVLYRSSTRLQNRVLAEEAWRWLFEEGPGLPEWDERRATGKELTSFLGICTILDFDPQELRNKIKELTAAQVVGMGRPAEYRRLPKIGG